VQFCICIYVKIRFFGREKFIFLSGVSFLTKLAGGAQEARRYDSRNFTFFCRIINAAVFPEYFKFIACVFNKIVQTTAVDIKCKTLDHSHKTQSGPAVILRTTAVNIKGKTLDHSYKTQSDPAVNTENYCSGYKV
jgi:hypothetical protein